MVAMLTNVARSIASEFNIFRIVDHAQANDKLMQRRSILKFKISYQKILSFYAIYCERVSLLWCNNSLAIELKKFF